MGHHDKCDIRVLDERKEYTNDTMDVIQKVTSRMGTLPVGTFKYKIFKYPGDIDIFERLEHCCTYNAAKIYSALEIQSIIKDICKDPDIIFTDFKAGYDTRYKIYTGIIDDNNIIDYEPVLVRRDISNLWTAGLLSDDDYNKLMCLVKDRPNINDMIILNEELRKYWLIRWNQKELLTGYKILPGSYKLYLDIALSQGTVVKLDTISKIDNRYVEVSNFFLVIENDKYGNKQILSEELGDYEQSLLSDVYKYFHNNPLKSVKRLWMYLAFKNKICDLSLFTDLFSSDIALESQIISDLEVAIQLLNSNQSTDSVCNKIYDQQFLFQSISNRLSMIGLSFSRIFTDDIHVLIGNLSRLKDELQINVNNKTLIWLHDNEIDISKLTNSSPGAQNNLN